MLSHGLLVARTPPSAMDQHVLRLLLTSLSENEIADRLGLTCGTMHGYVTEILRRFQRQRARWPDGALVGPRARRGLGRSDAAARMKDGRESSRRPAAAHRGVVAAAL
jgi:DNA-binding NarL/FixJ family response regulator